MHEVFIVYSEYRGMYIPLFLNFARLFFQNTFHRWTAFSIMYEEKEVQNGLFYHFIYKILVVNWSNMLHRKVSGGYQQLASIINDY